MKINQKILSIPPYISTSWKNIASLYLEQKHAEIVLVIDLISGTQIEIPQLERSILEAIFAFHAKSLEQETIVPQVVSIGLPLKMEHFGTLLQHNAEQSNAPILPAEILEKLAQLTKSLGVEDPDALPKAEPHCNCLHCQIAKAVQGAIRVEHEEEEVSEDDLRFRTWDIKQTTEKLYLVSNPIDDKEHYSVYLGNPIGCTCGKNDCEHIHAVLKT